MFRYAFLLIALAVSLAAPAQSGWYVRQSPSYDQCIVLVDSVPGGFGCVNRLSAMCTQGGVGYSRGYANYDGPVTLPITLELYQPPTLPPIGSLTITSLGQPAIMSLNGAAGAWTQAAAFTGASCSTIVPRKPNDRG